MIMGEDISRGQIAWIVQACYRVPVHNRGRYSLYCAGYVTGPSIEYRKLFPILCRLCDRSQYRIEEAIPYIVQAI